MARPSEITTDAASSPPLRDATNTSTATKVPSLIDLTQISRLVPSLFAQVTAASAPATAPTTPAPAATAPAPQPVPATAPTTGPTATLLTEAGAVFKDYFKTKDADALFAELDKDKDGLVAKPELTEWLRTVAKLSPADSEKAGNFVEAMLKVYEQRAKQPGVEKDGLINPLELKVMLAGLVYTGRALNLDIPKSDKLMKSMLAASRQEVNAEDATTLTAWKDLADILEPVIKKQFLAAADPAPAGTDPAQHQADLEAQFEKTVENRVNFALLQLSIHTPTPTKK